MPITNVVIQLNDSDLDWFNYSCWLNYGINIVFEYSPRPWQFEQRISFFKKFRYLISDMQNKKMHKTKDIIFCNNERHRVVKTTSIFHQCSKL